MSKALMHEKKLPYKFWGEVVNTTVYIQNRCPTRTLNDSTSFESFSGRKPRIKHLRVFGFVCYCHVPSQLRTKLDDSATRCIFVGKCEKGHRVYNLQTNKVTVSRSVIFDEDSLWDWKNQNVQHISIPMSPEDNVRDTDMGNAFPDSSTQEIQFESSSPSRSATPESVTQSDTPVKLRTITNIYARCHMSIVELENYEASKDAAWKKAMEDEMERVDKNDTWELVH